MLYIVFALLLLQLTSYQMFLSRHRRFCHPHVRTAFKVAASLCAAGIGLCGSVSGANPVSWVLTAGLVTCALADGVLQYRFVPGMGVFFAAHLLLCVGFALQTPPGWVSLGVFFITAALLSPMLLLFRKHGQATAFLAYGMMLCIMMGFAAVQELLLVAGAAIFICSDFMVAMSVLDEAPKKRAFHYLAMGLYYIALDLIALSMLP